MPASGGAAPPPAAGTCVCGEVRWASWDRPKPKTAKCIACGKLCRELGVDFAAGASPTYVTDLTAHPVVRGVSSLYFLGGYAMTTTDATAVPFASIGAASVGLALAQGAWCFGATTGSSSAQS